MKDRWTYALLAALLLGHLFLLATGARGRGSRIERLVLAAVAPITRTAGGSAKMAASFADAWRPVGSLREENRRLRRELAALRPELVRLHGVEHELELLSRKAGYTPPPRAGVFVADVVYLDPASSLRTLVLHTAAAEPRRNQPVLTERGLVGRIVVSAGRYAKVLLITDPSAAVSAMIARTRLRGLVRGAGPGRLTLDHVLKSAEVDVGDEVVTAGIDGVFPRGIPVGRVSAVEPDDGLFHRIAVRPAIDLASLEQVYVLTGEAVPAEIMNALSATEAPGASR